MIDAVKMKMEVIFMMRSLFAGVSGLKNHQTRMDVIGNNIANVNTIGYKKSRVTFQDMLSQTLRGASSPQGNRGGTNPMQVGLGMSLSSIDVIHTSGSPQSTGKNTDLAIEGDGFFILGCGSDVFYTRAGNFDFDEDKNFYNTSNGYIAKGVMADANGVIDPKGDIVNINLASQVSSPPKATSTISYAKNLDSRASILSSTASGVSHTNGVDTTTTLSPSALPITKVSISGLTENTDYTVDYMNGTVTIVGTSAAATTGSYDIVYYEPNYQAPMNVYDTLGNTHLVNVYYTKTATNEWQVNTVIDNDFLETSGTGTITFKSSDGTINTNTVTSASKAVTGASALNLSYNFTNITEYAGDFTVTATDQNGYAVGDLQDVAVDTSGTITGRFSNGQSRKLAQLALATFPNPAGLMRAGSNLFKASNNSGESDQGLPGISGRGTIKPETLEMSNVDLSQEFVDMIITQRGFQANSRVITTSDQILEELVNLRR